MVPMAVALVACLATATFQVASGTPGIVLMPTLAPMQPLGTLPPLPVAPTLPPFHFGGLPRTNPPVTLGKTKPTTMSEGTTLTTAAAEASQEQTSVETAAERTTTAPVPTHPAATGSASQTKPAADGSATSGTSQAGSGDDQAADKTTAGTSAPATTDAPAATNTTTTATTQTETTTTAGCNKLCKGATCKSLIQKSAFHDFLGDVDSCPKARDLVVNQCPVCAACPLTAAGCGILEPISTPAPEIHGPPCEATCVFRESKATCGSRIMWASQHSFPGKPDACNRAYGMVLKQCPICKQCTSHAAGCPHPHERMMPADSTQPRQKSDAMTDSDLFDCQQLSDFKEKGQTERISWCCKHKRIGCEGNIDVLQRFGGERRPQFQATMASTLRSSAANVFMAGFLSLFGGYMVARRCSQTTSIQTPARPDVELPETRALLE